MDQALLAGTIVFDRRPGEAAGRVALGTVVIVVLLLLLVKLLPILLGLLTYQGSNATLAKVLIVPTLVLFTAFAGYMTWQTARSLRSALANRYLPLLTINEAGVMLYAITAKTLVPWNELLAVRVESFRFARFLKLDVRNPNSFRDARAKNGITLGLQPLDGTAEAVAEAIRRYPAYSGRP